MMEPTANELHAGCLGNINATWTFHGRSGHSARPWLADNAIERAAAGRSPRWPRAPPEPHEFDGLEFREVASVTQIAGGIAAQRDPRPRARADVNFRYAPGPLAGGGRGAAAPSCARGHGELRDRLATRRRAPVADGNPLVAALIAAGELARRAQAGVDAGRRVRAPPGVDAVNFGPGEPAQAHRRDESVAVAALVRALPRPGGVRLVTAHPGARRAAAPTRSCASTQAKRAACGARRRGHRLRHRRAARGDARVHPRGARRGAIEPLSTYPLADGLPELREAIAGWAARRFGARAGPRHRGRADARAPRRRSSTSRRCVGGDVVAVPTPGYPVPERGALFAGREVVELPLRAGARLPARPRRASTCDWRVGAAVAQLPEQPDGARRRRSSSTSAPPRWPASTTSCWPPTRPTRELYFGGEPPVSALQLGDRTQRRRVQHAVQALVDARLPRPGSWPATRELVAALKRYRPNVGVAPQEFVQRAAVAAWGDEEHVDERARRATAPSATCCCRRFEAAGLAPRGRRRDVLPLAATPARTPTTLRRAAARARRDRRAGLVLRRRRRGLPAARARPDARRVPARGGAG